MIEYKVTTKLNTLSVFSEGKKVGEIRFTTGYQYFPNGQKTGGEIFYFVIDCKKSLESESESSNP